MLIRSDWPAERKPNGELLSRRRHGLTCILIAICSDRSLPHCLLCEKTSRACIYPSTRLKPGPKLGRVDRSKVPFYQELTNVYKGSRNRKRQRTSDEAVHISLGTPAVPCQGTPTEQFSNPPAVVESQGFDPPAKVWEHQNGFLLPRSTGQDENIRPGSSHVSDTRFVRAISLSALVHPSHEANVTPLSRGPSPTNGGFFVRLAETQNVLMQVCESLGLSVESLQLLCVM